MDMTLVGRLETALSQMGPDDDRVKVQADDLRALIDSVVCPTCGHKRHGCSVTECLCREPRRPHVS
jgi:hypothetical protein